MCGINGIYGFADPGKIREGVSLMNDALSHRGPDDEGIYVTENGIVGLGHRRLSIIDLSSAGHQPMHSSDKRYTIVFNGEIYNFRELKKDLKNYSFKTGTDTEVILAAYERWGIDTPKYLEGMFAFGIWDSVEKTLFLCRDRLGIKPLYLYRNGSSLLFSSEIRALLSSGFVPRKLNKDALDDYLAYQTVHSPNTIIKDVTLLTPGHSLLLKKGEIKEISYWDLQSDFNKHVREFSRDQIKKDIYDLLYSAVEKRLIADVPFGAFLSGGIDSSIIVGLMSQILSNPVKTFSVTFEEEEYSEAPYARMIAKRFNTDHTDIRLSPVDFLNELPSALSSIDHPSGDGPNTYVVSKVTRNAGVTMALSGLGGDELFAGYDIFKRTLSLEQKQWILNIPKFIRKTGGSVLQLIKPSIASDKIRNLLNLDSWDFKNTYPISREVLLEKERINLLGSQNGYMNQVNKLVLEISESEEFKKLPTLSRISIAEFRTYLLNVLLRDTDQMSMASALEVRVPFLDHKLIEYVLGVPDKYKYPATPKKLLIDATSDLLPDEVVNRPKMGFILPWQQWLKNELRSFSETRIANLADRGIMDSSAIHNIWQRFMNDDVRVSWSRVWPLIVLEEYLEKQNVTG